MIRDFALLAFPEPLQKALTIILAQGLNPEYVTEWTRQRYVLPPLLTLAVMNGNEQLCVSLYLLVGWWFWTT